MLLSFSVDYMRPLIVEGFRQWQGATVTSRVKRQTIRARGPRSDRLLECKPADMPLHLWWKSRTKQREFIGAVSEWTVEPIHIANRSGALTVECNSMSRMTREDFALADGFVNAQMFRQYFVPQIGDVFNGVLYKW